MAILCHSSVGIQIKSSGAALYAKSGSILNEADQLLSQIDNEKAKYGGTSKSVKRKKKGGGILEDFIAGVFLIGICIPMVWMNERRQVRMDKVITQGQKNCVKDVDI